MLKVRLPVTCTLNHVGKRLANGVNIVVVEDKTNTKPAASMTFGVGKNNDPKEFPGLAHFCEHMLFMGTEKYPSEDAYHTAVKRNGGSCNAFTSNDVTSYHFTSSLDSYKSIVDMFLEFFIAPSFNVSAVDRELNAVNSEDERNHTSDPRRVEEMLKTFAVPEHPRHRYGSGNMTTLKHDPEAKGLSVHDALRTFFGQYYVADQSCLVLYSPYPADEMFALVEPTLLRMKPGSPPPQSFVPRGTVIPAEALGRWCNVLNTSKQRSLSLKWQVPFGKRDFLKGPTSYVSHMIGHEVQGTVLAALRAKGLATALSCGGSAYDGENTELAVKVTLTDKGLLNLKDVVDLVFMYAELMRRLGPSDARIVATYAEMKVEALTRFEYSEVPAPSSHCSAISCGTVHFGPELALCGGSLSAENSLPEAFEVLELMTADRCIAVLSVGDEADLATAADSPANAGIVKGDAGDVVDANAVLSTDLNSTTRFHKMRYNIAGLSDASLQRWSREAMRVATIDPLLSLPSPNPFLSAGTDFTVYGPPNPSKVPERIETAYGYALVKRSEAHLQQPKLYTMLHLFLTNNESIGAKYYRELMVNCLNEALVDTRYYADLAGLSLFVISNCSGLVLRAEGPSPFVPSALVTLVERVLSVPFMKQTEEVFARHHKKKVLALRTTFEGQPSELGNTEHHAYFSADSFHSWRDGFDFSGSATYEGYCAYVDALLAEGRTELVVDGNMPSIDAIKASLVDKVDAAVRAAGIAPAPSTAFPPYNDFYVPNANTNGQLYLMNLAPFSKTNVNTMTSLKLWLGPSSPERYPTLKVLGNIIASPFFNTLRSTEALGYSVHASINTVTHREAYLSLTVQSPVADPLYLYSRIHAFIDAFGGQVLAALTDEEVAGAVKGQLQTLKQRTTSVASDGARIVSDRNNMYGMDWREKEIAFLETEGSVTKAVLLDVYDQYIANGSPSRVGTVVFVNSEKLPLPEGTNFSGSVQLPPMRRAPEAAAPHSCCDPAALMAAAKGAAVADSKLVMSTFEGDAAVSVTFTPIASKAEAHAVSRLTHVPHK